MTTTSTATSLLVWDQQAHNGNTFPFHSSNRGVFTAVSRKEIAYAEKQTLCHLDEIEKNYKKSCYSVVVMSIKWQKATEIEIMSLRWLAPGIEYNATSIEKQKTFVEVNGNPNPSIYL